jgi:aminopeptidase N
MTFFDYFSTIAQTPEALARVEGLLDGRGVPRGIVVDQNRRWALVSALADAGRASARARIDAEEKRDPTTAGRRSAYAARAGIPDLASKRRFWEDFRQPGSIPLSSLRSAAARFHGADHPELSEPFVEPFFAAVTSIDWTVNESRVDLFFDALLPQNLCSPELLHASRSHLASAQNLTPLARRAWLEANDELARCIAVRERAGT